MFGQTHLHIKKWKTSKTYIISLSCFDFANPGHNVSDTETMIPQCSCLFAVERFSLLRLGWCKRHPPSAPGTYEVWPDKIDMPSSCHHHAIITSSWLHIWIPLMSNRFPEPLVLTCLKTSGQGLAWASADVSFTIWITSSSCKMWSLPHTWTKCRDTDEMICIWNRLKLYLTIIG